MGRCFSNFGVDGAGDVAGRYGRWRTTTPSARSTGRYPVRFFDLAWVGMVIVMDSVAAGDIFMFAVMLFIYVDVKVELLWADLSVLDSIVCSID